MKFNPAAIGNKKYNQGHYIPKNPQKYIGDIKNCIFRSQWEKDFFQTCDLNPAILQWGAELMSIPYHCPVTGTTKNYFPDVFLTYMDKDGNTISECIEIKPERQALAENAKSRKAKILLAVNQSKWLAAQAFCEEHGMKFRVLTEVSLYGKRK